MRRRASATSNKPDGNCKRGHQRGFVRLPKPKEIGQMSRVSRRGRADAPAFHEWRRRSRKLNRLSHNRVGGPGGRIDGVANPWPPVPGDAATKAEDSMRESKAASARDFREHPLGGFMAREMYDYLLNNRPTLVPLKRFAMSRVIAL